MSSASSTSRAVRPVVVCADWGIEQTKRWVARAEPLADRSWRVFSPEPASPGSTLRAQTHVERSTDPVLIGVDFPVGIPRRYAQAAQITSFRDLLEQIGTAPWDRFADVADAPEQISVHRPFYPRHARTKGSVRRSQLTDALGLSWEDLHRRCELAGDGQRRACPLFWTLGANQAGKGALAGWPLLRRRDDATPRIWPFDGRLDALLIPGQAVIAEIYPADAQVRLEVRLDGSKRRRDARRAVSGALRDAAASVGAVLEADLATEIDDGFGEHRSGEDRFDALVGLLGMLEVVDGTAASGEPDDDPAVRAVEGWILGRRAG